LIGLRVWVQVTEGKERIERILAGIQDAFVALDVQQRYSFVNTNAAIMLGAKKEGRHRRVGGLCGFARY
jgi:PAS domain-containing protein